MGGWAGQCRVARFAAAALFVALTAACETTEATVALGVAGATIVGGATPSAQIEETYYLGVFDPQDQLPPTVYRVRVRGQASLISFTRFASGWVPGEVIDTLGTKIDFDQKTNAVSFAKATGANPNDPLSNFTTGRRLMLFGPEGFREAPANHRLVVIMGQNPEAFFGAVDETLGTVAAATQETGLGPDLGRRLFETLVLLRSEREGVDDVLAEASRRRAGGTP